MAGTIEAIEEYIRSCHGVIGAPLSYIIRKIILVQTYDDYPMYVTPDYEMVTRMLHFSPDNNKLFWCMMVALSLHNRV